MISASTRRRLASTVLAGCLLSTILPGGAARAAPSAVTVVMASGGHHAPTYQILVHNGTTSTIDTTVRQELPRGTTPTVVSDGGQTSLPAGQTGGTEVSWRLQLPPGGMHTLNTALAPTPPGVPMSAPACAFAGAGDIPFDCASATWQAGQAEKAEDADTAIWQRPAYLFGAAVVLLLLLVAGLWWWRRRIRQRANRGRDGGPGGGSGGGSGGGASRGFGGPPTGGGAPPGSGPSSGVGPPTGGGMPPGRGTPAGVGAPAGVGEPPFLDRPATLDRPPPGLARGLARGVARIRPGDGAESWPSPRPTWGGNIPPEERPATGWASVDLPPATTDAPSPSPSQPNPSQPGPTQASPSQASPSQASPSQASPSQASPSQSGSSRQQDQVRQLSATIPSMPDGIPNTFLSGGSPTAPPRPAVPGRSKRRTGPPVWGVIGIAVVIVGLVVTAATWAATSKVSAIDTGKQPTSGAWVGRTSTGTIGATMRDATFEFTIYRVNCGDSVQQPAGPRPSGHRCLATISARNVSKQPQLWYGESQRAYAATGNWVTTDLGATRAVNGGRDIFAEPVPPSERMLFPIVFTMDGPNPPTRVELRGAVFSAGVSVAVT